MDQLRRHLETISSYLVVILKPSWSNSECLGTLLGFFLTYSVSFWCQVGPCWAMLGLSCFYSGPSCTIYHLGRLDASNHRQFERNLCPLGCHWSEISFRANLLRCKVLVLAWLRTTSGTTPFCKILVPCSLKGHDFPEYSPCSAMPSGHTPSCDVSNH